MEEGVFEKNWLKKWMILKKSRRSSHRDFSFMKILRSIFPCHYKMTVQKTVDYMTSFLVFVPESPEDPPLLKDWALLPARPTPEILHQIP
jgi:hypothetical protein